MYRSSPLRSTLNTSYITAKTTFFRPNLRISLPQQVRHFLCDVRKQQGLACSRCVKTFKTTRTSVSRGPTTNLNWCRMSSINSSGRGVTLPKTNIAPGRRPGPKRKLLFQPQCFRCYVSFREGSGNILL